MIESTVSEAICVEVGWLLGLQHSLGGIKFGQTDASDFVVFICVGLCGLVTISLMCQTLWSCNRQSDASDFVLL